ncbi:hypothetical protein COOONC_03484 [Cooperia oncophora]
MLGSKRLSISNEQDCAYTSSVFSVIDLQCGFDRTVLAKIPGHQYIPKVRYAMAKLLAGKDHKGLNMSILYLQDVFTNCNSAFGCLATVLRSGASIAANMDVESISEGLEGSGAANLTTWLEGTEASWVLDKLNKLSQSHVALQNRNNPKELPIRTCLYVEGCFLFSRCRGFSTVCFQDSH